MPSSTYSRDEVVAEVTSYYDFIASVYLPTSVIKRPPPGGWSDITPEFLAPLNKNKNLLDLIRHLPFVVRDEHDEPYQIFEGTSAVDFTGEYIKKSFCSSHPNVDIAEPPKDWGKLPPHVLALATPAEGRNGLYFFIDTERGVAIVCDCQEGPRSTKLSKKQESDDDEWRAHATYTVKDFFTSLKEQFRSFKVIATSERVVEKAGGSDYNPDKRRKEIYEEHRVFTDRYDKVACLERIKEVEP
ncbi:hypothetical protein K505DRAFT_356656 [Melanomma pulvis-pyrius CBS 109.77]|uniref:Knr4/Smi1-like domain-containing protein n=1 Tax=Melanomma pulvis-pyrius CBS 109.77 TaxID=1314802 RepID=A0A6A6XTN6_9PLEO|nr:hypothetical protein K505DRAFT_356656 [Melanomma pulvis-pyrius CBS 109.77]